MLRTYFAFKNRNYRHKQDPDYFLFLPPGDQQHDEQRLIGKVFKHRNDNGTHELEIVFFKAEEHAPAGFNVLYASTNEQKVKRQDADMVVFFTRDDKTTERMIAGKVFFNRSSQGSKYLKIIIAAESNRERISNETDKEIIPGA